MATTGDETEHSWRPNRCVKCDPMTPFISGRGSPQPAMSSPEARFKAIVLPSHLARSQSMDHRASHVQIAESIAAILGLLYRRCSRPEGKVLVMLLVAAIPVDDASSVEEHNRRGPTTGETVDYINSKLSSCNFGHKFRQSVEVTGGRMSVSTPGFSILVKGDNPLSGRRGDTSISHLDFSTRVEFDLADLSTDVEVAPEVHFQRAGASQAHAVIVRCAAANCLDIVEDLPTGDALTEAGWNFVGMLRLEEAIGEGFLYALHKSFTDSFHGFLVCDTASAGRVQKAFEHLIRQSGGQEELF